MREILYSYAYDENNQIVNIDNIDDSFRKCHQFHCISCGKELIARLGEKKRHHFAHAINTSCNSETYLHSLAKYLIKKSFDESEHFYIQLNQTTKCDEANACPFFNSDTYDNSCISINPFKYDLKKVYDCCQLEQPVESFVPDILLTSSKKQDRRPIFIEIKVTHKSSDKKINSGYKVIELSIDEESDIQNIIKSSTICETSDKISFNDAFLKVKKEGGNFSGQNQLERFILYNSGAGHTFKVSCNQRFKRANSSSILEFNCYLKLEDRLKLANLGISFFELGLIYSLKNMNGSELRNCCLCKYYAFDSYNMKQICCLYKKFQLERCPKQTNAKQCPYYSINSQKVINASKLLENLSIEKIV